MIGKIAFQGDDLVDQRIDIGIMGHRGIAFLGWKGVI